jgi:hypothetical protein
LIHNCTSYHFNGQEKDDEVYGKGNMTTADYWQYDTRLGRRWNLDPVPQISISDYATIGNNPIWQNDPDGDKFKKGSQKKVEKFKSQTKDKIASVDQQISDINSKISKDGSSEELQGQLADLQTRKTELQSALSEIASLETSDQIFRLNKRARRGGITYQNKLTKVVVINYHDLSSQGHELKHAYQFINGEFSFERHGFGFRRHGGDLYDINDEVAAYKRTYAFNPELTKSKLGVNSMKAISSDVIKKKLPNYAYLSDVSYTIFNKPPGYEEKENVVFKSVEK